MIEETIPWWLNTMKPSELKTMKDMSPEQLAVAQRDGEYWAKEGLATWRYDCCNRCRERYAVLSPECVNRLEHQEVAARLARETKVKEREAAA